MIRKTSIGNVFWPYIYDEASAQEAAKQGWVAALVSGGVTLFMVVIGSAPTSSLIDVLLICLIGYGCLKMSRVAATTGLIYTLLNSGYKYITYSTLGIMPLFAIFYITSIRGTFAFHRIIADKILGNNAKTDQ